jgi:hypothetical protein
LKGKGVEVRHVLPFVLQQLRGHARRVPDGRRLLVALASLVRAYTLLDRTDTAWPTDTADEFAHALRQVGINAREAHVALLPKFHLLYHLGQQAAYVGNLKFMSTMDDEAYNADLVRIAADARTKDFLARLLAKQVVMVRSEDALLQIERA